MSESSPTRAAPAIGTLLAVSVVLQAATLAFVVYAFTDMRAELRYRPAPSETASTAKGGSPEPSSKGTEADRREPTTASLKRLAVLPSDIAPEDRDLEWYELGPDMIALASTVSFGGYGGSAEFKIGGRSEPVEVMEGSNLPIRTVTTLARVWNGRCLLRVGDQERELRIPVRSLGAGESLGGGDAVTLPNGAPSQPFVQPSAATTTIEPRVTLPLDPRIKEKVERELGKGAMDGAPNGTAGNAGTSQPTKGAADPDEIPVHRHSVDGKSEPWSDFITEFKDSMSKDLLLRDEVVPGKMGSYGVKIVKARSNVAILLMYGVEEGDVIELVSDIAVQTLKDLQQVMADENFSDGISFQINRGGKRFIVDIEPK